MHLDDLRSALGEVYVHDRRILPRYTVNPVAVGTPLAGADFNETPSAIQRIE